MTAWTAGVLSFLSLVVSIGLNPKPPAVAESRQRESERKHVLVKRTIRRVIVHEHAPVAPASPQVRYVTVVVPAQTSSSNGGAPPPTENTKGS